jgi:hypothetical protein
MSIDINDFKKIINDHMNEQPYTIVCECGEDLNFNAKIDSGQDLIIEVEPCKSCSKPTEDE